MGSMLTDRQFRRCGYLCSVISSAGLPSVVDRRNLDRLRLGDGIPPETNRRDFCQKALSRRDVHDTFHQEPLQPYVLRFPEL